MDRRRFKFSSRYFFVLIAILAIILLVDKDVRDRTNRFMYYRDGKVEPGMPKNTSPFASKPTGYSMSVDPSIVDRCLLRRHVTISYNGRKLKSARITPFGVFYD